MSALRLWATVLVMGLVALAIFSPTSASAAPAWRCSTLKVLVPYAPGGGTDVVARLVASKLGEQLAIAAVVENRPGGKSVIAYQALLREPSDGCTLLVDNSSHVLQSAYKSLPYNAATAIRPVSLVAAGPTLLAVSNEVPARDLATFLAYAKTHKVAYGSYGVGTQSHLAGEALSAASGASFLHIPYKGSAPALTDLLANQIQALFVDGLSARQHIKSGKIKALAALGHARWQAFPELPTFGELGFTDLSSSGWWGVFVAAATQMDVVQEIAAAVQRAGAMPDMKAKLAEAGAQGITSSPEQFAAQVEREAARWKSIITSRHIEIE